MKNISFNDICFSNWFFFLINLNKFGHKLPLFYQEFGIFSQNLWTLGIFTSFYSFIIIILIIIILILIIIIIIISCYSLIYVYIYIYIYIYICTSFYSTSEAKEGWGMCALNLIPLNYIYSLLLFFIKNYGWFDFYYKLYK